MEPINIRRIGLVSAVCALALSLAGCAVSGVANFHGERRVEVAHATGASVDVMTRNGSIEIVRRDGASEVEIVANIRARTQDRLDNTTIVIHRDSADSALKVRVDWPGGRPLSNESCSFVIAVPDAHGVRADTSNGALRIAGLSGEAVLTTSNGRVTVDGHDGGVSARTSNGRVGVTDVTGAVTVRTSNGRVEARNVGAPLNITTSNGAVTADLRPDAKGPMSIQSSNGSVSVVVGEAFSGALVMSTGNGRVRFTNSAGIDASSRGSFSIDLGEGGQPSRVRTSNGSITARVAKQDS